jgi:hypothetical protein
VFFGIFYLWLGASIQDNADALQEAVETLNVAVDSLFFYKAVAWLLDIEDTMVKTLFANHHPALLAFFCMALMMTPMLAMLASFDQTATEIRTRHMRFVLLRTDRDSVYVGKAIGTLAFVAICLFFAVSFVGLLLLTTESGLGGATGLMYLFRIWFSLVIFHIPFIALMALTNVATAHPYAALTLGVVLQFAVWAVSGIGSLITPGLANLQMLFPTAMKYKLVSDSTADMSMAMVHQVLLAAFFFMLGWLIFRKRDL